MTGSTDVLCTKGQNTIDNNLAKKGVCVRMKCAAVYHQEQFQDSVEVYYSKNLAIIAFLLGTATSVF